jgi:EpsI family protein
MYNYGFLIPAIAAYMVWIERDRIGRALSAPSYATGLPMLAIGLGLLIVGRVGSVLIVEEFSILPTLAGLVLLAGGIPLLRAVALPLAYLLFMIPFWEVVIARLHYPLQISSAVIAETILHVVRIPVHRTDTVLAIPAVTLEVAEACSGVNFLVAIAAIALPYVYLSVATTWRRIVVAAFAIAVAMISNGVRVALIGMSQQWAWWDDLHGPAHLFHGMVIAVVGYAAMFVGARYLGGEPPSAAASAAGPVRPAVPSATIGRALTAGAVILAVAAAVRLWAGAATPAVLGDGSEIPRSIGDWTAADGAPAESAVRASGADRELARSYASPGLGHAHLYVGAYAAQVQGHELPSPPAGVTDRSPIAVVLGSGEQVRIVSGRVAGPPERVVLYWYDVGGRVAPDPLRAKGLTIWNGLLHHRTAAALVAITLDPPAGVDRAHAEAAARALAAETLPAVRRYLGATN